MSLPLSEKDIAEIKMMLERGDAQQGIAMWFGVHSDMVAETKDGTRFKN